MWINSFDKYNAETEDKQRLELLCAFLDSHVHNGIPHTCPQEFEAYLRNLSEDIKPITPNYESKNEKGQEG